MGWCQTADWRVLRVLPQTDKEIGYTFILQINKQAEDILYPKFGKMKRRNQCDNNPNALDNDEVERDLEL